MYGVASYAAVQRTREIGIRMALGAQRADVMRLVLRQSATMVVGGGMAGLCGAALTAGALTRAVGMEAAIDPIVFVAATAALSAAALGACYLPARRAIAVAPTAALREE